MRNVEMKDAIFFLKDVFLNPNLMKFTVLNKLNFLVILANNIVYDSKWFICKKCISNNYVIIIAFVMITKLSLLSKQMLWLLSAYKCLSKENIWCYNIKSNLFLNKHLWEGTTIS